MDAESNQDLSKPGENVGSSAPDRRLLRLQQADRFSVEVSSRKRLADAGHGTLGACPCSLPGPLNGSEYVYFLQTYNRQPNGLLLGKLRGFG